MAAAKCSQCGFVGARGNEVCKRCGASLYQTVPSRQEPERQRNKLIPIGIASGIIGSRCRCLARFLGISHIDSLAV
jgi:hypothetical protein